MIFFCTLFNLCCLVFNIYLIYYSFKRRQEDKDFVHFLQIKKDFKKGGNNNGDC